MAEGKWIPGLTATIPVTEAARRALSVRLEVVRRHLPLALRKPDQDPEHVHRLRVAARRAAAALEIFGACLSNKQARAARKCLRRLRRAAGAARDWDVFRLTLQSLSRRRSSAQRPGFDFLIGYSWAQRGLAQAELEKAAAKLDLTRLASDTVAAVRDAGKAQPRTLMGFAGRMLRELLDELDRTVAADLDNYENLHQVRIAGKRLRYAMEVFADCLGSPFRAKIYPAVEEMQEILGLANDSHVAMQRLNELRDKLRDGMPSDWPRWRPGIEACIRFHQRRLPQQRRRFLAWWERWQTSGTAATLREMLDE